MKEDNRSCFSCGRLRGNSNASEDITSEKRFDIVSFYRWQTTDKKSANAKIEMNCNTEIKMRKEDAAVKEHTQQRNYGGEI